MLLATLLRTAVLLLRCLSPSDPACPLPLPLPGFGLPSFLVAARFCRIKVYSQSLLVVKGPPSEFAKLTTWHIGKTPGPVKSGSLSFCRLLNRFEQQNIYYMALWKYLWTSVGRACCNLCLSFAKGLESLLEVLTFIRHALMNDVRCTANVSCHTQVLHL